MQVTFIFQSGISRRRDDLCKKLHKKTGIVQFSTYSTDQQSLQSYVDWGVGCIMHIEVSWVTWV